MERRFLNLALAVGAGVALAASLRRAAEDFGAKPSKAAEKKNPAPETRRAETSEAELVPVFLRREHYIRGRLCKEPFERVMHFAPWLRLSNALTLLGPFLPEDDRRTWTVYHGKTLAARLRPAAGILWRCELLIPDRTMASLRNETFFFCHLPEDPEAERMTAPQTLSQLEALLRSCGFPRNGYSPQGGLPSEAFCVEKLPEGWHVYYSERGGKSTLGKFRTEAEAVACFLEHVGPYLGRGVR